MQMYLHCIEGKKPGDFIPLGEDGTPRAVLDRQARRVEEEDEKKA